MMKEMMSDACMCAEGWKDYSYTFLRVVIGIVFLYHGWAKIGMGMEAVTGMFMSISIPAASFFAYAVSYGELIVGALMIAGIFTHFAGKYAALIMIGTIYFVHGANGFDGLKGGYEYQLVLLAASIYLMTMGNGKYSLTALRKK